MGPAPGHQAVWLCCVQGTAAAASGTGGGRAWGELTCSLALTRTYTPFPGGVRCTPSSHMTRGSGSCLHTWACPARPPGLRALFRMLGVWGSNSRELPSGCLALDAVGTWVDQGARLPTHPCSIGAASCPRSEDSFLVQDYAQVGHIQVHKVEPTELSLPGGGNRSSSVPHPFQVTLLHNSEGRQEKVLLSSDSA